MATVAKSKESGKADKPDRVIALITGESGTGKSFFIGSLKNAEIYDVDLGGGLAYLDKRIKANGSERFELGSWPEILANIRKRAEEGTLKPTVVIDHITALHQEARLRYNPGLLDDFNKSGDKATSEWRKLREFIKTCDCNLFAVSHTKEKWKNQKATGEEVTDGAKNIDGDFHIVLRLEAVKDAKGMKQYPSNALTFKWRRDPEDERGAVPSSFAFTMAEFERINGLGYQREREKVEFAKVESVQQLKNVLAFVGEEKAAELQRLWLQKAVVDKLEEMTEKQVQYCINQVNAQMKGESK